MTLRTTLLFCAALLLSSCNLETTDVTPAPAKPAEPKPSAAPATPTTPATGDGEEDDDNEPASQAFLWKPVSDNFGKLVVILPASFASVNSITVSGARTESSTRSAIGNGQRPHYRFSLPGASYGKNIRVTGGGRTWIVADGSKRTQQ
jgi:hypothetical protein